MLKKNLMLLAFLCLHPLTGYSAKNHKSEKAHQENKHLVLKSKVLSPDKKMNEAQVFDSFGCTGGNQSPDLEWSGAPKETKTFAVTVYDPDAPTGSGWWHWVLYNIPANVTSLEAGIGATKKALPAGAKEGRTDFGKAGYGGPCPPPGTPHRYIFKVYALKDQITVDAEASPAMVGFNINQLKIAEGVLEAKYGR